MFRRKPGDELTDIMAQAAPNFKLTKDKEPYVIIGSPGLRSRPERLAYLLGTKDSILSSRPLVYPEIHRLKDDVLLCECPEFDNKFSMNSRAEKFCQFLSLEIVLHMAKAISGVVVVMEYPAFFF